MRSARHPRHAVAAPRSRSPVQARNVSASAALTSTDAAPGKTIAALTTAAMPVSQAARTGGGHTAADSAGRAMRANAERDRALLVGGQRAGRELGTQAIEFRAARACPDAACLRHEEVRRCASPPLFGPLEINPTQTLSCQGIWSISRPPTAP